MPHPAPTAIEPESGSSPVRKALFLIANLFTTQTKRPVTSTTITTDINIPTTRTSPDTTSEIASNTEDIDLGGGIILKDITIEVERQLKKEENDRISETNRLTRWVQAEIGLLSWLNAGFPFQYPTLEHEIESERKFEESAKEWRRSDQLRSELITNGVDKIDERSLNLAQTIDDVVWIMTRIYENETKGMTQDQINELDPIHFDDLYQSAINRLVLKQKFQQDPFKSALIR